MALERFVSRSSLGWGATPAGWSTTNLGMIAHYDSGFWLRNRRRELVADDKDPHIACREYWIRTRNMHKSSNGWLDVGYAYFVCPDDWIFAGREVNHIQAAEAPTPGKLQYGNSRYVAATFGLGPGEQPTAGALRAWARLRDWLMDVHGVKSPVYGHRDFTSTSCPGEPLYDMVRSGALKHEPATPPPVNPKPPTVPVQEDDMIDYASFGSTVAGATDLAPGVWTDVNFDIEYDDPTNVHPAGVNPSILKGNPTVYWLEFGASVEGGTAGEVYDVDVSEYLYDSTVNPAVDKLVESGEDKATSMALTSELRVHHAAVGNLRKGGKLRVRVRSGSAAPVKLKDARVSVAFAV